MNGAEQHQQCRRAIWMCGGVKMCVHGTVSHFLGDSVLIIGKGMATPSMIYIHDWWGHEFKLTHMYCITAFHSVAPTTGTCSRWTTITNFHRHFFFSYSTEKLMVSYVHFFFLLVRFFNPTPSHFASRSVRTECLIPFRRSVSQRTDFHTHSAPNCFSRCLLLLMLP